MASPVELGILNAVLHAAAAQAAERADKIQEVTSAAFDEDFDKRDLPMLISFMEEEEARLASEVDALRLKLANRSAPKPAPKPQRQAAASAQDAHTSAQEAMMKQLPTEHLARILAELRGQTASSQVPMEPPPARPLSHRSLPPSISLAPGETTALVDILAMMREMPTPALAEFLTTLRGVSRGGGSRLELTNTEVPQPHAPMAVPPPPSPSVLQSGRAQLLRAILLNFFTKHQPSALHTVEQLCGLVVGDGAIWTEGELFQKLEARYGVRVDIDPHGHDD
jgi:hypothetical protein